MQEKGEIIVNVDGKEFKLAQDFIKFERQEKTVLEEKFIPAVIEPSFGIGRIIYCIYEHCFKIREKDA